MDSVSLDQIVARHARWNEARQAVVSRNIAHVDTPDAKAQRVESFADAMTRTNRAQSPVRLARTNALHLAPQDAVAFEGATVAKTTAAPKLESEMIALGEARRAHDLNTAIAGAFHRIHIAAVKAR